MISGIVHVLQSGCRWKDAPAIYGPPKTLCNRNVRWAAKGVWQSEFGTLAAAGGPRWLVHVTPVGGLCLLLGWLWLAVRPPVGVIREEERP